jgi:integrase
MRGNPNWIKRGYLFEWAKLSSMKRLWEDLRRENMKHSTFKAYLKSVKSVISFAEYEDPEKFLENIRNGKIEFDELCDRFIEGNSHIQNSQVRKHVLRTKRWLRANLDLKNGDGLKINLEAITLPKGNQKGMAEDIAPTRLDLKELVSRMKKTRDKAYTLVAASAGLRPETQLSLNVGEVEFQFEVKRGKETEYIEDIGKINITPGPGRKVRIKYYTFITPEAKEMLQKYLEERRQIGEKITKDSPLWVTHFDIVRKKTPKNWPKRLTYDSFSVQWRRILQEAGLDEKSHVKEFDEKGNAKEGGWFWHKYHLKTLRKFFRTEVTNARCIEDLKYFWLGQPSGVHRPEYYREHLDVAVDEYRRIMPNLMIEKALVTVEKEELEKRDQRIEALEKALESIQQQMHELAEFEKIGKKLLGPST